MRLLLFITSWCKGWWHRPPRRRRRAPGRRGRSPGCRPSSRPARRCPRRPVIGRSEVTWHRGGLWLVGVRSRDTVAASDWCSPGARCWRRCRGRGARSPAPGSSPRTPPTPPTRHSWTPAPQTCHNLNSHSVIVDRISYGNDIQFW